MEPLKDTHQMEIQAVNQQELHEVVMDDLLDMICASDSMQPIIDVCVPAEELIRKYKEYLKIEALKFELSYPSKPKWHNFLFGMAKHDSMKKLGTPFLNTVEEAYLYDCKIENGMKEIQERITEVGITKSTKIERSSKAVKGSENTPKLRRAPRRTKCLSKNSTPKNQVNSFNRTHQSPLAKTEVQMALDEFLSESLNEVDVNGNFHEKKNQQNAERARWPVSSFLVKTSEAVAYLPYEYLYADQTTNTLNYRNHRLIKNENVLNEGTLPKVNAKLTKPMDCRHEYISTKTPLRRSLINSNVKSQPISSIVLEHNYSIPTDKYCNLLGMAYV